MNPNKYYLNKKASYTLMIQNNFKFNNGFFVKVIYLYKRIIKLMIIVDADDNYFTANVLDDKNNMYAPFYNPEERFNNLVAKEVIEKYNKNMDILVEKGILKKVKEKPEIKRKNKCNIKIKYATNEIEKLNYIDGEKSDWIDLRAAENVVLKKGEFKLISLGIAMKLPEGYEAHIVPRSSTFKNFGIIQTNHMGVIDESYCGDDDIWKFPAYAIRDTEIHINDRICQFRIMKKMERINFEEVKHLNNKNRGGFGSTGKR